MSGAAIEIAQHQQPATLYPDPSRVVLRPFTPADNPFPSAEVPQSRTGRVIDRVLALDEELVRRELVDLRHRLDGRHAEVELMLSRRFHEVVEPASSPSAMTSERMQLIGGYLMEEYAVEAAALFNPSIVPHPDQSGTVHGELSILMSLRAVGEGHVSSITFREGLVSAAGELSIAPARTRLVSARASRIPGGASDDPGIRLECGARDDLSRLVLFPVAYRHRHGLEDLRLTRFVEDDGSVVYLGTYTGVGGETIRQELLRTTDFQTFDLLALQGRYSATKGMALFPRRIGGYFAMLGRQDHENIWLLRSNDLYRWDAGDVAVRPRWPWEFVQLGNCGPPIEVDEGWLVVTHGVGPIRSYALGACLLDRNDPTKLLGRTREPLVVATDGTRDGYVPNVIYSCGALVHGDWLILPHGVADSYTTVTTLSVRDLLGRMS
ncbi:glycoside hydrolase family 130 protein [Sphingomonas adhaesiva]|uniref:glycoside hydrolase family 130 protein n=1 Tax=Sphingomonas adhaesiva TaxID=28212 RepID=UPI000AAD99F6|nr:glycoside hydrolase family 130 protein [Sphingomonas adhaesiva]